MKRHEFVLDEPSTDLVCLHCGRWMSMHRYLSADTTEERLALVEDCPGSSQGDAP